jgi:threonine/homoserine/homoserine lactone efflux protein
MWYLLLGRVASAADRLLSRSRVRAWLDRAAGIAFVGFGVPLAAETRV